MKETYTIRLNELTKAEKEKFVILSETHGDVAVHDHNFFELAYVTGGMAEHEVNGRIELVQKGNYFIIDYGSTHGYHNSKEFSLINCLFLPEIIDDTMVDCKSVEELFRVVLIRYYRKYNGEHIANQQFFDEDGLVYELMMNMLREYTEKKTGYIQICQCCMIEILIYSMRKLKKESVGAFNQKEVSMTVASVIEYVNRCYAQKAVLKSFCAKEHYSIPYVSRTFKKETGITIKEYLSRVRMEKSCRLLSGSELLIQEIAERIGYEDVAFFRKSFIKTFHMTPREYRNYAVGIGKKS